jgi:hypothetical protein
MDERPRCLPNQPAPSHSGTTHLGWPEVSPGDCPDAPVANEPTHDTVRLSSGFRTLDTPSCGSGGRVGRTIRADGSSAAFPTPAQPYPAPLRISAVGVGAPLCCRQHRARVQGVAICAGSALCPERLNMAPPYGRHFSNAGERSDGSEQEHRRPDHEGRDECRRQRSLVSRVDRDSSHQPSYVRMSAMVPSFQLA